MIHSVGEKHIVTTYDDTVLRFDGIVHKEPSPCNHEGGDYQSVYTAFTCLNVE